MKEYKFNFNSKSQTWFLIKQNRFDTTIHPIITSRKTLKCRMKTLVSHQEKQELEGLTNTLQCDEREAIRIALYEAARRGSERTRGTLEKASRSSNIGGHTKREKELKVSLPCSEKEKIMELAKELDLSEKEVFRLAFIWLANGVKSGAIKNIRNCKLISQDKLAKKWSRENRGKAPNPSVKKLKEDINLTQELYEFGVVDLAEIFPGNFHARHYGEYISQDLWKEAKKEAEKHGKELIEEGRRGKMIIAYIWFYDGISRAKAEHLEKEDYLEYQAFTRLSKKDTLKLFKKVREELEDNKYKRDQEREDQQKESKSKPFDEQVEEAKSITSGWERYEREQEDKMRKAIRIYYGIEEPDYSKSELL